MDPQDKKHYNSVFWVEVDKIRPNPYQPRKEFDEAKLRELGDSIRQYGVLQPLVVTRHEETRGDGGIQVYYELIAGERRTRAARLAGVHQVPVLIREGDASEASARLKLELAIIENLQREDLSPIERARAFKQLTEEFGFKHSEVAQKIGKSREYVTNSIRLLLLPAEMLTALEEKKISEGHTRPLLMLADKKEEQDVLFKDIIYKRLNVREAEITARAIAVDRARKPLHQNPEFTRIEREFVERLGTRVRIDQREKGGKIIISFFSDEDLQKILDSFGEGKGKGAYPVAPPSENEMPFSAEGGEGGIPPQAMIPAGEEPQFLTAAADESAVQKKDNDDEDYLYSVKNFTV
ncbi:MAG: ParB/RepB/Spo0J family partition protein [Parcubacteria group bacterium]|nr:ParB/RepB/Spo0J family partition protein [Parcubacteria group bacterium]